MTATIYYFSGTGNSLYVARRVAEQLGDCSLVNIARLAEQEIVEDHNDTIGIVFPTYSISMPDFAANFVRKLSLDPEAYVFGITTYHQTTGIALPMLKRLLKGRGISLSAGFKIKMPGNLYLMGSNQITRPEKRGKVLQSSEAEIEKICDALIRREKRKVRGGSLPMRAGVNVYGVFVRDVYDMPKRFKCDRNKCERCYTCIKVCPVENISRVGNNAKWGDKCTQCMACFHWCPRHAIQIGKGTVGLVRYHHPKVVLEDVLMREYDGADSGGRSLRE